MTTGRWPLKRAGLWTWEKFAKQKWDFSNKKGKQDRESVRDLRLAELEADETEVDSAAQFAPAGKMIIWRLYVQFEFSRLRGHNFNDLGGQNLDHIRTQQANQFTYWPKFSPLKFDPLKQYWTQKSTVPPPQKK